MDKKKLTYDNHKIRLQNELTCFYEDKTLCDVQIQIDEQHIDAHKNILASGSGYFRDVLVASPEIPVLVLKGYDYEDVRDIIEFIYKGEVSLTEDRLDSFNRVAMDLKIFGFIDGPATDQKEGPIKIEKGEEPQKNTPKLGLVSAGDGRTLCLMCKKSYKNMADAKYHYKSVHLTDRSKKNIQCKLCDKKYSIQHSLIDHMRLKHGITEKQMQNSIIPEAKAAKVKNKKRAIKDEPTEDGVTEKQIQNSVIPEDPVEKPPKNKKKKRAVKDEPIED